MKVTTSYYFEIEDEDGIKKYGSSRFGRITAHFLTCFLALLIYRYLEKALEHKYTCEEILKTLKDFNFAYVKEQGFIPLYKRTELTDKLHEICHFNTDFEFITNSQMRTIKKTK